MSNENAFQLLIIGLCLLLIAWGLFEAWFDAYLVTEDFGILRPQFNELYHQVQEHERAIVVLQGEERRE